MLYAVRKSGPLTDNIHAIADRLAPAMKAKFLRAVANVQRRVDMNQLLGALASRDPHEAFHMLGLDHLPAQMQAAVETIRQGFVTAAEHAAETLSATLGPIRFDLDNAESIAWVNQHGAELVTQITDDTKAGIRDAISRALEGDLTVREAAVQLRSQIGLTDRQMRAVEAFRERLTARDAANIDARTAKYAEAQLRHRAETIARSETMQASSHGQRALWLQAQDKGLLPSDQQRVWIVTPDERLCDVCEPMDGEETGIDDPWDTENGPVDVPSESHPDCRCSQGIIAA